MTHESREDLAMRARMAEVDAKELREALIQALFRGTTRPSNETLLTFAVERIEHSWRIAPDNPLGRSDADPVRSTDGAVALLRGMAAQLRGIRTDEGYRLALLVGDVEHYLVAGASSAGTEPS